MPPDPQQDGQDAAPPPGGAAAVTFPEKGLNIMAPYTAQPPGTTPDCLNVQLFDPRTNRGRGGQRAGFKRILATPLGSGGPVVRMHQTVRPAAPASLGQTLYFEDFHAANPGNYVTNFGGKTVWTSNENGPFGYGRYAGCANNNPSAINLSPNRLWHNSTNVSTNISSEAACLNDGGYSYPTDNFEVVVNVQLLSAYNSPLYDIWCYGKGAKPISSSGDGIALVIDRQRVMLDNFPGSHTPADGYPEQYNFPTFLQTDVPVELTLRFVGNKVYGMVNGVIQVASQWDNTLLLNNSGVGFGTGGAVQAADAGVMDFRVRALPTAAKPRQAIFAAVCDTNVYAGSAPETVALVSNGASQMYPNNPVSSADLNGWIILVDGVNTRYYDAAGDGLVHTLTSSLYQDGTPKGQVPQGCTLASVYRGRLILARPSDNPQNIYMSRALDPMDWDYSQEDPLAAVALNASASAGRIGQPVNAVFPTLDDQMVIGCDQSLYMMQGDPADGGNIITLSDATGVIGKDAICMDPQGDVYLVGHSGFFKIPVAGYHNPYVGHKIENISMGRLQPFFSALDVSRHVVQLQFLRNRQAVWIFVWDSVNGGSKHLFYDTLADAFFYMQFPDSHGPVCSIVYEGASENDRRLLVGGTDGFIRDQQPAYFDDDGQAINSYVYLGPFRPGDDVSQMKLDALDVYLGEIPSGFNAGQWNCQYTLQAAKDAYASLVAPRNIVGGTFANGGRQLVRRHRLQGGAFTIKVFNNQLGKFWTLERMIPTFVPAGRQR